MNIDIQVYNGDKKLFFRKNMEYDQALGWLYEKEEKGSEITDIDIQVYTNQGMPLDDSLKTNWLEARQFIKDVANNASQGKYRGVKVN